MYLCDVILVNLAYVFFGIGGYVTPKAEVVYIKCGKQKTEGMKDL